MDRVEATGTDSGTIHLKQAFAPFMMSGVAGSKRFHPLPAGDGKSRRQVHHRDSSRRGPYPTQWTPKQQMVFTPNLEWKGAKPAFEEVRYILIDYNKAAELAFEADEIDVGLILVRDAGALQEDPASGHRDFHRRRSAVHVAGHEHPAREAQGHPGSAGRSSMRSMSI